MSDYNLGAKEVIETQSRGLSWIMEMEAVSDPTFSNALLFNIFRLSKKVIDVQIVCDSINKRMLIWIKLTWWGRKFHGKKIEEAIVEMVIGVLPNYELRVVQDREILDKSLKLLEGVK